MKVGLAHKSDETHATVITSYVDAIIFDSVQNIVFTTLDDGKIIAYETEKGGKKDD